MSAPVASRSLRIAHLTTVDMSLALLLGTELRADVEAGHEVVGISAPGPFVGVVEALDVQHVAIPHLTRSWSLRRDLAASREIGAALRRLRPDVLHTHTPKAGVLGRVLGRALGVPVVVNTCHGLWLREGDPALKRAIVVGVEGVVSWFSHAELFQNADDRRALRRFLGRTKGVVVGNGVDLERFRFDVAGRARVRAELGVADGELLVGGVGRRVAEKGILELDDVARRLGGRARFVWFGPDDEHKFDAVRDLGGDLRFVGVRDDMPAVYSALDVFVLPSHREGFSRSAMEAAACGRPMVLSDIRGCREIGCDGEQLLLVPARDPGALAAALGQLLEDEELRRRLGAAAVARARVAFDQRKIAEVSLSTYAEVARRKKLAWG